MYWLFCTLAKKKLMEYKIPTYLRLVIILLGIILTVFVMITAKSILVPLLISGLFAVLISPLASWLEKHRVPKFLAAALSLITLLAGLSGLAYFFYNQLIGFSGDLSALNTRMSELIGGINTFLENHIEGSVPISMSSIQNTVIPILQKMWHHLHRV
jgi:predicted PurR-regulated permease PerM